MPFPRTGTERARPDLAQTLFEFDLAMNMNNFVALEVFPVVEVSEFKGTFGRVNLKEILRRTTLAGSKPPGYAFERAIRAAYATEDTSFSEDSYETKEHGLQGIVDEREAASYRSYFEHEAFTAQWINHQLMEQTEIRVSSLVFDPVEFAPGNNRGVVVATQWTDEATSTPIKDVRDGVLAMYDNSGIWADTVLMNRKAWKHLIATDDIKSAISSQGAGDSEKAGTITRQAVAQAFDVEEVIVAGGTGDASNPNASSATPTQIWGPHCSIFKKAKTRNLREVTLGRTFHWPVDRSLPNGYVEDFYDPDVRAQKLRVRHQMVNQRLYSDVGYLLQNVI